MLANCCLCALTAPKSTLNHTGQDVKEAIFTVNHATCSTHFLRFPFLSLSGMLCAGLAGELCKQHLWGLCWFLFCSKHGRAAVHSPGPTKAPHGSQPLGCSQAVASRGLVWTPCYSVRPPHSPRQNLCLLWCLSRVFLCYFNRGLWRFISWRVRRKYKWGQLLGHALKQHLSTLISLNWPQQETTAGLDVAWGALLPCPNHMPRELAAFDKTFHTACAKTAGDTLHSRARLFIPQHLL